MNKNMLDLAFMIRSISVYVEERVNKLNMIFNEEGRKGMPEGWEEIFNEHIKTSQEFINNLENLIGKIK